ncbi:MAG: SDR family NAD(P)-dependent oxidoreductase [Gemmataceae bacterium]
MRPGGYHVVRQEALRGLDCSWRLGGDDHGREASCARDGFLAVRSRASGEEAVRRFGLVPGEASVVELDAADAASVRRAADEVASKTSRLDVLVNNAGMLGPDDDWSSRLRATSQREYLHEHGGPLVDAGVPAAVSRRAGCPAEIYRAGRIDQRQGHCTCLQYLEGRTNAATR